MSCIRLFWFSDLYIFLSDWSAVTSAVRSCVCADSLMLVYTSLKQEPTDVRKLDLFTGSYFWRKLSMRLKTKQKREAAVSARCV